MNVFEEVQLAIDMKIESALEFVLIAKTNYHHGFDKCGYWGIFNNKVVWISCVASGKELFFGENMNSEIYKFYRVAYSGGYNYNFIKEIWDGRTNNPYPKKYHEDENYRLKYELKYHLKILNYYKERSGLEEGWKRDYYYLMVLEQEEVVNAINKKLNYNKRVEEIIKSGGTITEKSFDIPYLKTISIDGFVEINRAGFFRVRDNDKTPSCKWYKEDNTWVDFGGDNKKHDVIDLIMIMRGYNFVDACKFLMGF